MVHLATSTAVSPNSTDTSRGISGGSYRSRLFEGKELTGSGLRYLVEETLADPTVAENSRSKADGEAAA